MKLGVTKLDLGKGKTLMDLRAKPWIKRTETGEMTPTEVWKLVEVR